jgi:uncharacterized lipoprotein YmbA
MKPTGLLNYFPIFFLALVTGGCLSVSDSPVPRFYTLTVPHDSDEIKKFDLVSKVIIGVGPVEIPEYQNRPQMVTRGKDGMLKFAQFERWGEALDAGLARLIVENLTLMLPKADFQIFPCNFAIPLDYQVIISIVQLDSQLDKNVFLIAQWTIINTKTKAMLLTKRTQINQPVDLHNYAGLAQALSKAAALISEEIAENLSKLSFKSATKDALAQ